MVIGPPFGGNLRGQTALVTRASGALGCFQVQLAYQQGASVTAIASAVYAEELRALEAGVIGSPKPPVGCSR
jgi:NADPH:quinone reductase